MNIQKGIVKDVNHFANSNLFERIRKDYPKHDLWWKKVLNRVCWFSVVENDIIAACIVKIEEGKNCDFSTEELKILKISLFVVSDKYKNIGLGSLLLDKVESFAIDNEINDVYVSTKSTNEDAINFFIKKKFQIVQIQNNEIYLQKKGLNNYIEINRKAYETLSNEYKIRGQIKSGYEETPQFLTEKILKILPQNYSYTILEIGPGSGEIVEEFENKGHRTFAVELSLKVARFAKEKSPKTVFINSNILETYFLYEQFDIIYAGALIHLFKESDANKVLAKIHQWLKKTGVLFINTTISEVNEEGFYYKNDYNSKVKRYRRKWKESDFKNFIEKKFKIEEILYTNEVNRKKKWVGFICKKH